MKSPSLARRNVVTAGIDLNSLIGKTFTVQGVDFEGICECKPCYWMDSAIAPGAEKALQGRGGLRARILSSGRLRWTVNGDPYGSRQQIPVGPLCTLLAQPWGK